MGKAKAYTVFENKKIKKIKVCYWLLSRRSFYFDFIKEKNLVRLIGYICR